MMHKNDLVCLHSKRWLGPPASFNQRNHSLTSWALYLSFSLAISLSFLR